MKVNLFSVAKDCLEESELDSKLKLSLLTSKRIRNEKLDFARMRARTLQLGRPDKPLLVSPARLEKRGFATQSLRLALAHAIAHIEFNAINLAWDAIWRFQDMPEEYYRDWVSVAEDETRHFMLLRAYMNENGCDYGDYPAHDGLWTMAEKTAEDVLERMAIVPRVLEARGLDVSPTMIAKLRDRGDLELAGILETIYQEEIGHVLIGNRWFRYLCESRGLEADTTFLALLEKYNLADFNKELNIEARLMAGFSQVELESMSGTQIDNK